MPTIKPRRPAGFPEYLPRQQIEFNRLLDIIRHTYEKYGFTPLDTPDLELSEVLLTKSGGETEQQIYRFTKGSNDLTMRFDLTIPLARYTAEHQNDLVFPFRRYHIGKVHRGERSQAGRFREFYQCDIDVIGTNSPIVDAELPAIISEIFEKFDFGPFTIRLNNRLILNGFFEGIGQGQVSNEILRLLDKMDKISTETLTQELSNLGLSQQDITSILQFTQITGSNDQILSQLQAMDLPSPDFKEGVDKLSQVIQALDSFGVSKDRVQIDLKIARGLDYYTGTVYETTLDNHPEIGSVCSGGRYDNLASHYTNTQLPGVGISIGLSRLFHKLEELGLIKAQAMSPAQIIVVPIEADQLQTALRLASQLRQNNLPTVLYSEPGDLKKKLRYADKMGFRWVAVIGPNEQETQTVSLKDMDQGQSQSIAIDQLAQHISALTS